MSRSGAIMKDEKAISLRVGFKGIDKSQVKTILVKEGGCQSPCTLKGRYVKGLEILLT